MSLLIILFPPPSPTSATEAVISHPDEMESLEQYSVLADYRRKDSHQVNLSAGQVVHVIEKHDTGEHLPACYDRYRYIIVSIPYLVYRHAIHPIW